MILRCDLAMQYRQYQGEIDEVVRRTLASGKYILDQELVAFEQEFAAYMGAAYGVGVANATDALTLCLMALGIGPGDEVITTAYTAIPTSSAIIDTGARPIFVDICPDTYLMDLQHVARALTPRTKAVIPVHIFGNVVDIPALRSIVGTLPIIEDASQSHGSRLGGKQSGSIGDFGVFSFYPTKNLGAYGDGGMVITPSAEHAERLKLLRMYGMAESGRIVINGINSRLDELQAAILRVKLRHLDEMNARRNLLAKRYVEELDSRLFDFQTINEGVFSSYHLFAPLAKVDREGLHRYFESEGIQTSPFYPMPLHLQKANEYLGLERGDLPMTESVCSRALGLPFYPELRPEVQDRVIAVANSFLKV